MKLILYLFFSLYGMSFAGAESCISLLSEGKSRLSSENIENKVKYLPHGHKRLPYLDLKPEGAELGSVMLFSGFSKNMNSWIDHANELLDKGYRVILFDQSNVGRNLRENGLEDFKPGTGFVHDVNLALKLLTELKPQNLVLVGHSRGARIAAELASLLNKEVAADLGISIRKLLLLSPYTEYVWKSELPGLWGYYADLVSDFYLVNSPSFIGALIGQKTHTPESEKVPGLEEKLQEQALGYILKGTYPGSNKEIKTLGFIEKSLENDLRVQVLTGAKEVDLTPLKDVESLDVEGVEFSVLDEEGSHYWPYENLPFFAEKVVLTHK